MESVIRSLPLPVFIGMLAFAFAMAGIAVFAGVHARRRAGLAKTTAISQAATAAPGYRQFEGHVEAIAGQMLTAPLTGWSCVWYHAKVEKLRRESKREHEPHWEIVSDVTSDAPFLLRDISGRAMVQPYGADVTPTDKSLWYGTEGRPSQSHPARYKPTEQPAVIESVNTATHNLRYFEERIYNGDPLLVSGVFSRWAPRDADEADADEDANESADAPLEGEEALTEVLTARGREVAGGVIARGTRKQPLLVTTTPHTQHVDLLERGALGAFGVALVPLALAAMLLSIRCS